MIVRVKSGSFSIKDIEYIAIIHGGAGPSDPKGPRAAEADLKVKEIAKTVANANVSNHDFGNPLKDEYAPQTLAEKRALIAANLMEAEPRFNAGYGSALQADGKVRVSASYMESTRRKFSAVINIADLLHPSHLAAYLQTQPFGVLDSLGSFTLADGLGMEFQDLVTDHRQKEWIEYRKKSLPGENATGQSGTIGCVSFDTKDKSLAAITSTGGVGNETPGRVGDVPTVAGNFCTEHVATSCTGFGEQITSSGLATKINTRVSDGMSLKDAMEKSMNEAKERQFQFAAISLHYDQASKEIHWATGCTASNFTCTVLSN